MYTPNILIVSDAPNLRTSIAGILIHAGFHVDIASVTAARKLLDCKQFQFLFLDLSAPYRDGLKLLSSTRFMESPVCPIVISSTDSLDFRAKVMRNGAKEYLLKPVDPIEIIRCVQKVL